MKLQMNKYEDKYQTLRLLQSLAQVWGNGMKVNNVRKGSSGAPTPFWNNVCANAYLNLMTYTNLTYTATMPTTSSRSTQYPEFGPRLSDETKNSSLRTANARRRDVWSVQGASSSVSQRRCRDEFNHTSPRTAGKPQGLAVQSRAPETKKPMAVQGDNSWQQQRAGQGHGIFTSSDKTGSNAIVVNNNTIAVQTNHDRE